MVKETNWERQIKKPQNESMRKQKLTRKSTEIFRFYHYTTPNTIVMCAH